MQKVGCCLFSGSFLSDLTLLRRHLFCAALNMTVVHIGVLTQFVISEVLTFLTSVYSIVISGWLKEWKIEVIYW